MNSPVIYFDGVCSLCNGWVDFLMRIDHRATLRFAPLQGETAARVLGSLNTPENPADPDSIVFARGARVSRKSDAVAGILLTVGGPWRLLGFAIAMVPRSIRDRVYDLVARNRYRWFGKRDFCRRPTAEESARLLP